MKLNTFSHSLYKYVFALGILVLPQMSFAAVCSFGKGISGILLYPHCIIQKLLLPLLITAAFFFFVLGVIRYLANADSDEARKKGANFMMWGVIALAVLLSVWGLVAILTNTLQLGS